MVNRQGQFVGIIFDGNLESLVWDFVYTEKVGRAIAVHSAAIEETLRKLYDAGAWRMNLEISDEKEKSAHFLGSLLVLAIFAVAAWLLWRIAEYTM